jgi:putative hemolysin
MPAIQLDVAARRAHDSLRPLQLPLQQMLFRRFAHWLLDTRGLEDLWSRAAKRPAHECVFDRVLHALDVTVDCSAADLARVPESGPLLLVANHPHGLLDGLVLGSLLARRRSDFRLLANSVLAGIDGMAEFFIAVDVFGGDAHRNGIAARHALRWMRRGGAIAAFPAGEVSALTGVLPQIADRQWSSGPLELARTVGAKVVPAFISGHNGLAFQMAGVAHPALRTLLLGRELLNKRGSTVRVAVGQPISLAAPSAPRGSASAAARTCSAAA